MVWGRDALRFENENLILLVPPIRKPPLLRTFSYLLLFFIGLSSTTPWPSSAPIRTQTFLRPLLAENLLKFHGYSVIWWNLMAALPCSMIWIFSQQRFHQISESGLCIQFRRNLTQLSRGLYIAIWRTSLASYFDIMIIIILTTKIMLNL